METLLKVFAPADVEYAIGKFADICRLSPAQATDILEDVVLNWDARLELDLDQLLSDTVDEMNEANAWDAEYREEFGSGF